MSLSPKTSIITADEKGLGPTVSSWDEDPQNPRNWSSKKKWTATAVVALYSLVAPMSSVIMAPALETIAQHYHEKNSTVIGLTLSIYLLLFAFGPLIWAPLSEMYGRTSLMHVANVGAAAFNLGCAFSPNITGLIVMRLFTGFFASAAMTIGAGSISDLFAPKDRASAMSLWALGPLLGPSIGPIMGGYIAQYLAIKWIFIIMAIITAAASVVGIPLLQETYAPILQKRIAKEEGKLAEFIKEHPELAKGENWADKTRLFWNNLRRPVVLLFQSWILFMLATYMAFLFGMNYLMFSTFPTIFREHYGFKTGAIGLSYLGVGLGCIAAVLFSSRFGDQLYHYLGKRDGENKPEHRLPALIFGSLFCPIGLFWYGWSAQAGIHWIMPILGTGIFAFGMMTAWLPIQIYVVDVFVFAASASSTLAVFRSLVAFSFPLFARQMFTAFCIKSRNGKLLRLSCLQGPWERRNKMPVFPGAPKHLQSWLAVRAKTKYLPLVLS